MSMALLAIFAGSALGAPELTATQSLLTARDGDDSAYLFAKVENTGDVGVGLDSGSFVVMNENSELMFTDSYVYAIPGDIFLNPGEYAYVYDYVWESALEEDTVGSHILSFDIDDYYTIYEAVPCEAEYVLDGTGTYNNYINVIVTNNTDALMSEPYVTVGLYDAAGNLIYANGDRANNLSIYPGSSIMVSISIDNEIMEYYDAHGLMAASVDAIVYYEDGQ